MKPLHYKTHTLAKRGLSLLCVLALCLGLLPVTALAAGEGEPAELYVGDQNVRSGENTTYWVTTDSGGLTQVSDATDDSNDWNVKYDPNSATLTLKGAKISGSYHQYNNPFTAGIYAKGSSNQAVALTIELIGTNTITGHYGIYLDGHQGNTICTNASVLIKNGNESGDNGSLTVTGTGNSGLLILSGTGGASLTIENASVVANATSSYGGSGVCVQSGASSKDSPELSLAVNGGSLTASGGGNNDGIQFYVGNSDATNATTSLTVSENAIVDARNGGISADGVDITPEFNIGSSGSTGGIVWNGTEGTVYGKVELQKDLEIGEGETLTVPSGAELNCNGKLTVDGGTLTQNGTVTGDVTYKVTGVSLNKTSLILTDGGSETLTATITPSNATNKNVTWSSNNTTVATVDNSGTVTAVGAGTAQITVTTEDGNKTATCTVTVTAKTYSLSVDKSTLNFGSITEGDALPAAQTVTVKNTGNQSVTLVQPTAENFEIGKLSETTLEPDETATFTIQPKDKLPRGSYSEQIVVSNTNDEKVIITATFTVKEPPYTGKYSYELTTSVGDHGSLTVDRYATEGERVTITVTPDDAYLLDELVVTAGGKEVTLTAGGDGTYTFTMPSVDVKISATFAEDPDWTEPEEPVTDVSDIFLDVTPNAWYKDAVQYAYAGGLMTGVSANEFAPEATTTRAMIVSMLARLEGVESAESAGFTDVAADDWYATAVNWAASVGVVNGFDDGTFQPNAAITREQLAAILMNYAQYKGQDVSVRATLDTYNDATAISGWANDVMSWAVAEGLLTGVTNDQLQPQGNATRAQVAAILQRFLSE